MTTSGQKNEGSLYLIRAHPQVLTHNTCHLEFCFVSFSVPHTERHSMPLGVRICVWKCISGLVMKYPLSLIYFLRPEDTEDLKSSFCRNLKSQSLSVPLLVRQDDVFWSCVWFAFLFGCWILLLLGGFLDSNFLLLSLFGSEKPQLNHLMT